MFIIHVNKAIDFKAAERQPLLNEHPVYGYFPASTDIRIYHQPAPNRNLQSSIHEEESLKQIVDRTRAYLPELLKY